MNSGDMMSYTCNCPEPFMGVNCELQSSCARLSNDEDPYCKNGGVCFDEWEEGNPVSMPFCTCQGEFSGARCHKKKTTASVEQIESKSEKLSRMEVVEHYK